MTSAAIFASLWSETLWTGLFDADLWIPQVANSFPASLFANGELGGWYSRADFNKLFTTYNGSTNVTAVNDAIGRNEYTNAGTTHALNATSTQRPLLKQLATGQYHLYHDRVDDKLTLESMPAGDYTIAFASFAGVFIYPINHPATGTLSLPTVDAIEMLVINRALTAGETTLVRTALEAKAPTPSATDVFRLYCYDASVDLAVTETGGSAGVTWELGDGQTATGVSCVKTITPPQFVIMRATAPERVSGISWSTKPIFGQIDLSKLTNAGLSSPYLSGSKYSGPIDISNNPQFTSPRFSGNQFTGTLDLSNNPLLTAPTFYSNQFTGTLDLSNNPLLTAPSFYSNQFTGTLDLSNNPLLTAPRFETNQFTGTLDLSNNPLLTAPSFHTNKFTGTLDLSNNPLLTFPYFSSNQFSGTLDLSNNPVLDNPRFSSNQFTGTLDLSNNPLLAAPTFFSNQFTGTLDLSNNPLLTSPSFYSNQFSGTLDLSAQTVMTAANFQTNNFTGFSGTLSNTIGTFNASSNLFNDAAINAILAALVAAGRTSASGTCVCTLNGSGNAAPTGQGLVDKTTLQSRGWTVTTN